MILNTAFLFWDSARFARSDTLLTFFMTLSTGTIILGAEEKRGSDACMVGASAAATRGMMTKGPVGSVLPVLTGFFLCLMLRKMGRIKASYAPAVHDRQE